MGNKLISTAIVAGLVFATSTNSQTLDSLSLSDCYRMARANAPQLELLGITQQEASIEQDKLTNQNLPGITAYGAASYQSDAIAMDLSIPGTEPFELDLFQYNAGLSVDQKLFDGGMVQVQKDIKSLESEIKSLETEAALYKINELINKYFFSIATLYKTADILQLKIEVLEERKKSIESAVQQGVLQQSEISRVQAEILGAQQQVLKVESGLATMKQGLTLLIGSGSSNISIKLPEIVESSDTVNRVELKIFEANRNYLQSLSKLQNKRYIPKFNAYGHAGYSYPGLNMFENQSDFYYIVGVKMGWNIFDWNQSKKEKQLINLQQSRIDITQLDFERNINLASSAEENDIQRLKGVILHDEEIIKHKEVVRKASASSLTNGAITSADYLRDLNEELNARHAMEKHKIELLEAQAKLAIIKGVELN